MTLGLCLCEFVIAAWIVAGLNFLLHAETTALSCPTSTQLICMQVVQSQHISKKVQFLPSYYIYFEIINNEL